jgi:hypothetical protein
MSLIDHLPLAAQDIAEEQGWNGGSLLVHLSAFIRRENLSGELTEYLAEVAEAEDAECEDI